MDVFKLSLEEELEQKEKEKLKSLFAESLFYPKKEAEDETNGRPTIFDRISLEEFCKQVEDVDFKYLFFK